MNSPEREIRTISFGRACRDRLGMYLSADPIEAMALGLREVYVNSLDAITESKQTNGQISIFVRDDHVTVCDNGPGIPNTPREDGISSLEAAFTLPHTGSHFDEREVNSIGLNGIGASVVTHTAKKLIVTSENAGQRQIIEFKGTPEGAVVVSNKTEKIDARVADRTGVTVQYWPDPALYGKTQFNVAKLLEELEEMMRFYPNVTLTVDGMGVRRRTFHYPKGLRFPDTKIYHESANLVLSLSLGEMGVRPFGNRLHLPQGGAFFTHFKTQMTRMVNDLSGLKLSGAQIQNVFQGYVAIFVSNPMFSNQSKTAISNKEVNNEITVALKRELDKFAKTPEWERVMKELETELRAEEAAAKARERVKRAMDDIAKGSKKRVVAGDKLKDCLQTGESAWLAITEGDSAQGALNLGRDIETVATFPIRGKFINCLKNKQEDYLNNEELIQIAQILGCGLFEKYLARNLKYGNVLIAVDADSDGLNIACLLTTFFYVCMPKFIQEGRLWWMRAPLYTKGKVGIFTEEDWKKVKNKTGFKRNKGLGEMNEDEVEEFMFGKSKQWLQLKPKTWPTFRKTIEDLMGKDVEARRDFLFANVDFERVKFL